MNLSMNLKIKIRKYGPVILLFIFTAYASSFFSKIFDPLNEFLLGNAKTPIQQLYSLTVLLLTLKAPVYSLLLGLAVVWITYKVYMAIKFRKSNLQIIKATYGKDNTIVDITDQLNSMVEDNKLKTVLSNSIAGDPIFGTPKVGHVKYRFNGKELEKQYVEGEVIELPNVNKI